MCVCGCVRVLAGVLVSGVCCFGGAGGCIPLTILVVSVVVCLCLYAYRFLDAFLVVKLGE